MPAFVRLLQDNEAEVRVAAASKVSAFCKIFNNEAVISALLPCIKELSTDSSQCAPCPCRQMPTVQATAMPAGAADMLVICAVPQPANVTCKTPASCGLTLRRHMP